MSAWTQATSYGSVLGCDFCATRSQLISVESGTGKLFALELSSISSCDASSRYTVLGRGYYQPEDVKLSQDGIHVYITERIGNLVRVARDNADRRAAVVIASGLSVPRQCFLDETHHAVYVVETAPAERLLRIDLGSGMKTAVVPPIRDGLWAGTEDDRRRSRESPAWNGQLSLRDLR